jgi:predicted unusual protein kinase regulating ubiquinone biosynthesis (AarF/ABC1/UbiB family)
LGYVDPALPDALRAAFGPLGEAPAPLSLDEVATIIEADFGAAARDLLHTLRSTPIAAGAVGQVHRSTLPDGTPVAIKIRRPEIVERVARELSPEVLAARLGPWLGGGPLDALAAELYAGAVQACDFTLAAQRQERFWWMFAGHPSVVVPSLKRAWCSARVLTSDFVSGVPLDKYLATRPSQEARDRAGEALFEFYVGMLFEHGLYACDPDPANHLFLPDGRVAFVDFGCVREPARGFVAGLAALTHALWGGEGALVERAAAALGIEAPDHERLRALYGPTLRDEVAAFEAPPLTLADLLAQKRHAAPSADLVFLARTGLGLATLLAQLGARARFRQRLQALLSAYPQPSFDVVLLDPGDSAISMARALLDATGLPLREIEYLIKQSPQTIKQAIPRAEAEALRVRLEQAGGQVEIKLASPD